MKLPTPNKKSLRVFLIQLIVFFIIFEISSIFIVHFIKQTTWSDQLAYYQQTTKNQLTKSSWNLRYQGHPLFGFVLEDDLGNNYNFLSQHNFPIKNTEQKVVIGIFGGSVASGIGWELEENSEKYKRYLRSRVPVWIDKDIVFVNFSLGGFRQPQQFFVASYFMETVDVALFLDGANELSGSSYPQYPLNFPKLTARFFSNPGEDYWKKRWIKLYRDTHSKLINVASSFKPVQYSSSYYLITNYYEKFAENRVIRLSNDLVANPPTKDTQRVFPPLSEEDKDKQLVDNWVKYLRLTSSIMSENKVRFISFIQPSQYVPNAKKSFTEKEKVEALDKDGHYGNRFSRRISLLVSKGKQLTEQGLPICNFTDLFRNEDQDIFIDKFCHVNKKGEEIIALKMLEVLSNSMRNKNLKTICD